VAQARQGTSGCRVHSGGPALLHHDYITTPQTHTHTHSRTHARTHARTHLSLTLLLPHSTHAIRTYDWQLNRICDWHWAASHPCAPSRAHQAAALPSHRIGRCAGHPPSMVSHTAWYPIQQGILHGMTSRTAWCPARRVDCRRSLGGWKSCKPPLVAPLRHLLRYRALGSPLPHLRRDWAHPCHICAWTGCPLTRRGAAVACTRLSWLPAAPRYAAAACAAHTACIVWHAQEPTGWAHRPQA
jgi:hypothetical protein